MSNDFEKILEKVIVPNDKQRWSRFRFDFGGFSRIKVLKIAGIGVILTFILTVVVGVGGGNEQGLRIKKSEEVTLNDKLLVIV